VSTWFAARFAGDLNYNAKQSAPATITINKATATVNVTGGTFTYDGNAHPATGTVTGVGGANLGTPTFVYTPGGSSAPVNAVRTPLLVRTRATATTTRHRAPLRRSPSTRQSPPLSRPQHLHVRRQSVRGRGSATGVNGETSHAGNVAYTRLRRRAIC
jgi:hypothetical protein